MARGWESKAVKSQIEAAEARAGRAGPASEEDLLQARRQSLLLSRQRVRADLARCRNPRYEKMLKEALADLDRKLAELA